MSRASCARNTMLMLPRLVHAGCGIDACTRPPQPIHVLLIQFSTFIDLPPRAARFDGIPQFKSASFMSLLCVRAAMKA